MAVKINNISVHKIQPPKGSKIDFGAEIRGADLENLSGNRSQSSARYLKLMLLLVRGRFQDHQKCFVREQCNSVQESTVTLS